MALVTPGRRFDGNLMLLDVNVVEITLFIIACSIQAVYFRYAINLTIIIVFYYYYSVPF